MKSSGHFITLTGLLVVALSSIVDDPHIDVVGGVEPSFHSLPVVSSSSPTSVLPISVTPRPSSGDTPAVRTVNRESEMEVRSDEIATTTTNSSTSCSRDIGLPLIPLFLWTEVPKEELGTSLTKWKAFYTWMLHFVLGNCVNSKTTRVILRVIHPDFPVANPMWNDFDTSPMFTEFISKLPTGIDLRLYPYLGGRSSPAAWAARSPISDPVDGVFQYAISWNARLAALNSTSKFSGIVLDLEEDYSWDWARVSEVKANYTSQIPSLGVSIGFDEIVKLKQLATFITEFYVQMYDFYTQEVRHITSNETTSPFVVHQDNPIAIANWLKTEVLTDPDLFAIYRRYRKQINIMWSTQNKGSSDCIYPLHGTCGSHYEFGLFKPDSFNQFIQIVTSPRDFPLFHEVQAHGMFQFDLIRKDWVPA